ncbi:MAG: hypothetical protein R3C59_27820 [Planctomycetaceae bacterium]
MRLTLRTLLAYLDDRLPPANARELGVKIKESPFAMELADRIKDVVRRRRLASDAPNQRHIEANLVAEYLDDQLTPELVALIEKEVLASDHSLAEVAAGHQILGLINDPVEIGDALKQRLYKLDPTIGVDTRSESQPTVQDEAATAWQPLAPQQVPQKRSPMPLLLVMVLGWLVLLFTDSDLFRRDSSGAKDTVAENNAAAEPNDVAGAGAGAGAAGAGAGAGGRAAKTAPADTGVDVADAAVPNIDAVVPNTAKPPVVSPPANGSSKPLVPNPTNPAVVDANSTAPADPAAPEKPTADAAVADTGNMKPPAATDAAATTPDVVRPAAGNQAALPAFLELRDSNQMILLFDRKSRSWVWGVTPETNPHDDWSVRLNQDVAAVPDPFSVQIVGRHAGWTAMVQGPALFRSLSDDQSGLELIEGRIVLQKDAAGAAESPADFLLRVHGRTFVIPVPAQQKRIGITVTPLPPAFAPPAGDAEDGTITDFDLLPLNSPSLVSISAADTDVRVSTAGMEEPAVIAEGQRWMWNTAANAPVEAPPGSTIAPAEWVFEATQDKPDSTRELMAEAARDLRAEASISNAAAAVSQNRNPQLAAYAVRLAALTRNVEQLTSLLLQSKEEVVRQEAIVGLRRILIQSPVGQAQVAKALENRLSEMEMGDALKLLAGVTRTAAEDRTTSAWLLNMLNSNREALREMAISNLEELTGERNGFFASDDAGRRSAAIRRWERYVERNDGRIIRPPQ